MVQTMISLFTGSSKWVYIALVVCALGFAGMTKLSVKLYGDKAVLQTTISDQKTTISDQKTTIEEKNELIEAQAKEVRKLTSNLAQRNADIQTQNALIEQNRIDKEAKEKEFKEAMAKKPKVITDIKYIPTGSDECKDLQSIIDEYIETGVKK